MCNNDTELKAWVIVIGAILVIVIGSCFSGRAHAGTFVELGLTYAHGEFDKPYAALGYRHRSGIGGAVAGWNYAEPTTYDSPYVTYDPTCKPWTTGCPVINSGVTKLPSSTTRHLAAVWFDYEMRRSGAALSAGAGYLSRATDVEDRRVVTTAAFAYTPKGSPCGLGLRALGRWGLVSARCSF